MLCIKFPLSHTEWDTSTQQKHELPKAASDSSSSQNRPLSDGSVLGLLFYVVSKVMLHKMHRRQTKSDTFTVRKSGKAKCNYFPSLSCGVLLFSATLLLLIGSVVRNCVFEYLFSLRKDKYL